jgi:ribosomal protein S13
MARIEGVDLPRDKRVEIGLTYIFGVGRTTSRQVLAEAQVNGDTRVRDLAEDEVQRLREVPELEEPVQLGNAVFLDHRPFGRLRPELAHFVFSDYRGVSPARYTFFFGQLAHGVPPELWCRRRLGKSVAD